MTVEYQDCTYCEDCGIVLRQCRCAEVKALETTIAAGEKLIEALRDKVSILDTEIVRLNAVNQELHILVDECGEHYVSNT